MIIDSKQSRNDSEQPIYLALSGGGVRAMAFHSGVLKFLAEERAFERVQEVSTVSGGTLLTGLIFSLRGMKWPNSDEYLSEVLPQLQRIVMTRGLKKKVVSPFFFLSPISWVNRIHRLTKAIEHMWGIHSTLADLPKTPEWIVNATSAETGKRFYFSKGLLQCHKVGSLSVQDFRISKMMAISAAVPGIFGPFEFRTRDGAWKSASDFMTGSESSVVDRFDRLMLYDGGVYDNLGLEQFLRPGRAEKRSYYKHGAVIVSDAGAPLSGDFSHSKFSLKRLLHVYSITADQVRALRVAEFMRYLRDNPGHGAHIRIGAENPSSPSSQSDQDGSEKESLASKAAKVETELRDLSGDEWNTLHTHGYEVARASIQKERVIGFGTAHALL